MIELRISERDYENLRNHLLNGGGNEEAAILIAGIRDVGSNLLLFIREIVLVPSTGLQSQSGAFLQVDPEFMAPLIKRCRYEKASFILAHSHPFTREGVSFSFIDDNGERHLVPRLFQRIPDRPHGFLVMGKESIDGRVWLSNEKREPIDIVRVIGERVQWNKTTRNNHGSKQTDMIPMYDRQVLAIGEEGQKILQKLSVGIVGLGGIGSHVATQLPHLGVKRLILIDDEIIEEANRSRVINARPEDVREKRSKVDIASQYAKAVRGKTIDIIPLHGPIQHLSVANQLRDVDLIFCCTDNLKSRVVLNRLSYQYLIPLIDLGMDIQLGDKSGEIHATAGRIMLIQPDGPCLECMGIITALGIDREENTGPNMPRGAYVTGGQVHAPAVVSLNGVIASLGVTRLIDVMVGLELRRKPGRYEMYLPLEGIVKTYDMTPSQECALCEEVKGLGDDYDLPCILDK